jgi:epimerase transport system membrane fusion protein
MEIKEQLRAPSDDTRGVIKFGLGVVIIVFILFGGWSAFAPLSGAAVAMGKVSADLNKKTLQHLEGGVIDSIYVKDGDRVNEGDLLIKLSDVQPRAQLDIFQAQYQDTLALHARLLAQRDELEHIVFPKELHNQSILQEQKNIFYQTKQRIEDEKSITKKRIEQTKNQISGLESVIQARSAKLSSIEAEIEEWEQLYAERLVDKIKIRELTRERDQLNGDIAQTRSEINKLEEAISELETQQMLSEKEHMTEVLERFVETKSILSDLRSKIEALKDTIRRTSIVAPVNGTVVGLSLHTVGGVVTPSTEILQIVPSSSKLLVVARVQPSDIDKVKVGLFSDIRFSAFNIQKAHVVEGVVKHVSADSFFDEQSGESYYEAKIEVTPHGEEQLQEYGFELVAGMPAEALILIEDRTLLSYLVKPIMDMIQRGFNEE